MNSFTACLKAELFRRAYGTALEPLSQLSVKRLREHKCPYLLTYLLTLQRHCTEYLELISKDIPDIAACAVDAAETTGGNARVWSTSTSARTQVDYLDAIRRSLSISNRSRVFNVKRMTRLCHNSAAMHCPLNTFVILNYGRA